MASDPTDLIRQADAALAQEAADEGGPIVDDPATLVRRLRDALAASEAEMERLTQVFMQQAVDLGRIEGERDEACTALAEANATIARVREACDYLEDGPMQAAVRHIRRAIEGKP